MNATTTNDRAASTFTATLTAEDFYGNGRTEVYTVEITSGALLGTFTAYAVESDEGDYWSAAIEGAAGLERYKADRLAGLVAKIVAAA